ncbi:endolytic transglycosylase MltG [Mesorhizobium sp. IMUNJ 23232]|uniref:endolytic transglycosylase MltG n=1 Tax=Mesorhizobium sp. IMUNJ 23232 TaxID=3376064 RepID=UPI0037A1974F
MSETQTNTAEFGRRPEPPKPAAAKTASEALRPEKGTPPPASRRSRASRNQIVVFMNLVVSLVMLVVIAAGVAVYVGKESFDAPGPATVAKTFLVKEGTGTAQIAAQLEQNGLISDALIFRLGHRAYGGDATLKAGEYEVPAGASMRDIIKLLQSGKSIMHSLTIPEGLTVAQALRRIADNEALSGAMPSEMPPEGSLAADTQRFTRGADRKTMIAKMQEQQQELIDEVWAKRAPDLPLADVNEFVTLASIVEKETGVDSERPHVASVFVNRLRKKMRLQSDPTIIYGLFGGAGKPADRPIYQSDLEKPTPYNTYVISGLPPTPIANPGRAALEAVANPLQTDDLYFVADGTGGHVFASSLDEHNRNVARWRAIQKQQGGDAAKTGNGTAQ